MSKDSVVSLHLRDCHVRGPSLANLTVWEQNELCQDDLYHMICCWQPTKRKTKPNNRVSNIQDNLCYNPDCYVEAAIDANAPLEDEDEANAGPIDSEEETTAIMTALKTWNPQPLVAQPVIIPIKRRYQLERLKEQLDNATSGGTVNIFKVVSKNGIRLPEADIEEEDDAPGEADFGNPLGIPGIRRQSSVGGIVPPTVQRKSSQASKA